LKKRFGFLILLTALLLIPFSARAEYIFLKDGSVIKGTILKDTDKKILIKADRGYRVTVKRSEILRVSYEKGKLSKQKIELVTGRTIQVYIVGEDQTTYIVRAKINSSDEITINKKDVLKIIQNRPSKLKAAVRWPEVVLTWEKPFNKSLKYYLYLAREKEKFKVKPYRVIEKNSYTLKGLQNGRIYKARVTSIGPDNEESVPSNICIVNYNSAPVKKVTSELVDRKKQIVRLAWEAPMENIPLYRVYKKTGKEQSLHGKTKKTEYVTKKKNHADIEFYFITTVNDQGKESEYSPSVNTYFLDSWYVSILGIVSVPTGFLADDFTAGTGLLIVANNAFDSFFAYGGSVSTVYNFSTRANVLPGAGMVSTFFEAFAGLNFPFMNKHLIIQPYVSAGAVWSYVTSGDNGGSSHGIDPVLGIGLRVPFDLGLFVVPFAEYRWIPDARAHQGHILLGVGVSI